MEARTRKNLSHTVPNHVPPFAESKKLRDDYTYQRSFSQGPSNDKMQLKSGFFSFGSLLLLFGLAASLLILPLVLPPLPPPPFMLLLLPIGILSLMILAFMPSNAGSITRHACT